MNFFSILELLLVFITSTDSATVLMLAHLQGSHVSETSTIGIELVRKGHEVYTILPQTSKYISLRKKGIQVLTFPSNDNDVFMESEYFNELLSEYTINQSSDKKVFDLVIDVTTRHCRMMLEDINLIELVKRIKFDIAVVDAFLVNYCMLILPKMLSIPIVSAFSNFALWDMGVPALPSFVSTSIAVTSDKLSFKDKLQAAFMHTLLASKYMPFADNELLYTHLKDVHSWNELFRTSVLFIQFRDEILEWPTPRMPNTIYLPGITYAPGKKLPNHIETLYQRTEKGVVIVSFGSSAGFISKEILNKFMEVFGNLKGYDIIWKFPLDKLEKSINVPFNVLMMDWLPQNDCLGHNKTMLFITHCGNNGQYESLYHGVPMLGFPMFADQHHNAFRIQEKGFGLYLDIKNFEAAELEMAINNILHNLTITQNVKKFSRILKERQHPKEEAVYWIEHVLKFGGTHLRGASMDMPWYQLLMFDILALIIVTICFIIGVSICICKKFIFRQKLKKKLE